MEIEEKGNGVLGEKVGLVFGFVATLVALYPLKDRIDTVKIITLAGEHSLTDIVIGFLLLLMTSMYFYAVGCIRFDFPNAKWLLYLRYFDNVAHVLYLIAIVVYPLVIVVTWLASLIPEQAMSMGATVATLTAAILSTLKLIVLEIKGFKDKINRLELEVADAKKSYYKALSKAREARNPFILVRLYNSLDQAISSRLTKELGLDASRLSHHQSFSLASKHDIITSADLAFIRDLRGFRNMLVHNNDCDVDVLTLDNFIEKGTELLNRLEDRGSKTKS